jgi:hypothetical protein
VYSFIHGYEFSFPYAFDVYRHALKFKLSSNAPLILGSIVAISIFALAYLAGKYRNIIRSLELRLEGRKQYVTIGIIGLTLLIIAYKGYTFAFTDKIPDPRWKIAGGGFEALNHYNLIVLAKMMTPVAFLLSLHGLYRLLQRWFFSHRHFVIGVLSLYFLVVYTYFKFMTPYLYYYARYLLSEVVPLLAICLSASLISIKEKNRKAFIVLLLLILIPAIERSFDARDIETNTTYKTLKSIDSEFSENAIVFIDKDITPVPVHLITPLRFTFNEKVFMFRKEDLLDGSIDSIFGFFLEKGHSLYIVSNDSDLENRYFSLVKTMPITSGFNLQQVLKASIYKHTPAAMELIDGGT